MRATPKTQVACDLLSSLSSLVFLSLFLFLSLSFLSLFLSHWSRAAQ
jgi:hypothetical protein